MKKRVLAFLAGPVFLLLGLASFFEKSIGLSYIFSKLGLAIFALPAGAFLVYLNYDAENKARNIYSMVLSLLVVVLGVLQLLSLLLPHIFAMSAPALAYKMLLLIASISILLSALK